jgi:glycosyltransferase involved in cell wall biosynthesis
VVVVPLFGNTPRSAGQQTVLNAMVLRKPVIVSDAPGIREYVQDGRDGIVVPPGDAEALGAALDRVLAGGPAIRAMTERAHARVEREFTPRSYLERLLAVACRAAGTWGAQRG